LLAGLGVGGIAVALSAQKTLENLIGAFAIAVDQPFREGDFVRIDNLQGTIEQIGMRSTRVRTLERTIVSIPNGKLADMQTETFAPRDRMRFSIELRLVYSTTVAQVREILANIEAALQKQPKLRPGSESAILTQLSHQAMVLEVVAFLDTLSAEEFNEIRQQLLLEFLEIIEAAGTQLALPAQRIELAPSDYELERSARATATHEATRETTGVVSAPGSLRRP
jgi:MscS family membrane protein